MPRPDLEEVLAAAHVVRLPMRVRFRGVEEREAVLLNGPAGWGEFSPFLEYPDQEAARWLASALEAAWQGAPPARRAQVPVNATVPAVPAELVAQVLARFPGCRTVKVKVAETGQDLTQDLARVAAVRQVLGEGAQLRVDANGGWDVEQALTALRALGEHGLEYAEQPCATVPELAELRRRLATERVGVLVAADESIRKVRDPFAVLAAGAADVCVIKVAPLGGVRAALAVAARLAEHDVPVVVSSALDTSVGIATGLRLAAALPDLRYACGLGTVALFTRDVADPPLLPAGGVLPVPAAAFGPDPRVLRELAAPPARRAWWLDRLRRCLPLVPGGGVS